MSSPSLNLKDIPRGRELCDQLGFRLGSARPHSQLLDSTHWWRRHYTTPQGIAGKELKDWKSPQVQYDLDDLVYDYLKSGQYGEKFWPAEGLPSPRIVPEFPKDKRRIMPLLSQLVWRQNTNESRNQAYYSKVKRKTQEQSSNEPEFSRESSPASSTNDSVIPDTRLPPASSMNNFTVSWGERNDLGSSSATGHQGPNCKSTAAEHSAFVASNRYAQQPNVQHRKKNGARILRISESLKPLPSPNIYDWVDTDEEERIEKGRRRLVCSLPSKENLHKLTVVKRVTFSCEPSFLQKLEKGKAKSHASNAKTVTADSRSQALGQTIIGETVGNYEYHSKGGSPRPRSDDVTQDIERSEEVSVAGSPSWEDEAIHKMTTRSFTSGKYKKIGLIGNQPAETSANGSHQEPLDDEGDASYVEKPKKKKRKQSEHNTSDQPLVANHEDPERLHRQIPSDDLGLEHVDLKQRLRIIEEQTQISKQVKNECSTPHEDVRVSSAAMADNAIPQHQPDPILKTQDESGPGHTKMDLAEMDDHIPVSDDLDMRSPKRSSADTADKPMKRAKLAADNFPQFNSTPTLAPTADEAEHQHHDRASDPIEARGNWHLTESDDGALAHFGPLGPTPETGEGAASSVKTHRTDIQSGKSENGLSEQQQIQEPISRTLPQTLGLSPDANNAQPSPAQAHVDDVPRAFTKFVIIKTRHPFLRTREWEITSMAGRTAESVFEDVGKIVQREFQLLTFRLRTSELESEVVIKRGEEDRFAQLQRDFGTEIRMDLKKTKNRNFRIELEPEPEEVTTIIIEDDSSDEIDLSKYL